MRVFIRNTATKRLKMVVSKEEAEMRFQLV